MAKPGARKDPEIRKQVRALLEQGFTTREIATQLDYSTQRIWELRKEIEAQQEKEAV